MAMKFRKEARHYRPGDEPYRRPLDRNDRARLLHLAEAMDRQTRKKGQHGGFLKRTGLAVLKALLCRYVNLSSGLCDPSAEAIAQAAGVSRATVFVALERLEAAGFLRRFQRLATTRKAGIWHTRQTSNAYAFNYPYGARDERDLEMPLFLGAESRRTTGTSNLIYKMQVKGPKLSTGTETKKASLCLAASPPAAISN